MINSNSAKNHNKLHKIVSSSLIGVLGVASLAFAAKETFPSDKPLPSVPGLTQVGPYQRYTVQPGDTPVSIDEHYGDPNLLPILEEQETNGVITPGQVMIVPEKYTNEEDYRKMATQPPVAGQNSQ